MELDVAAYRRVAEKWAIKDEDINPSAAAVLMLQMCSELERLQKADYEFQAKLADGITDAFLDRRWIPVSERLPRIVHRPGQSSDDVFIALQYPDGEHLLTIGYYSHSDQIWHSRTAKHGWQPTHWRPLPEPPEVR